MQDYERKSISEVVDDINRKYFLPDIQRSFVWKPEQVYALFDSIMRDYPISTFLFWKQPGDYLKKEKIKKLEFVKTSRDKNAENTEISTAKEYFLVLDGQQRLTTFYLVLKGNYIIRNNPYDLYFNVLSGDEEQEDGILYEYKFFNKNKGECFLEEEDNASKVWYRVKDIYDIKIGQIFVEVPRIAALIKDDHEIVLSDNQKNNIAKLCQYLKAEKIIYYYPEIEKDYDKVLDIFVRTNSGGTQLSYSDLLFSTIKSKWTEARIKFEALLTSINDSDKYRYSNDFILKTALVIYAKSNEQVRYKTKNFQSDLIHKIKTDWSKIEKSIQLCADIIKDKLFLTNHKTLPSYNALIPIIYWLFKGNYKGMGQGRSGVADSDIEQISVWLVRALVTGVFGGTSDTILYKCKEAIDANKTKSFPAKDIERRINTETKKSMKLDPDFLDNVTYNSGDSYLVLSICYKGNINFQPRMKGNLPEQDHIYSQDELETAKYPVEKINSIYNIRFIGSSENKSKSNMPISKWLSTVGKNKDELQKHLIPNGDWNVKRYDEFLKERKKLITACFNY